MRLNLRLTGNIAPVPFTHLHRLTGFLHDRIGKNNLHDGLSLYSFGWLAKGQKRGEGRDAHLTFPHGTDWRVSFHDAGVAKRLIEGIMRDSEVFAGMRVFEVKEQAVPAFNGSYRFKTDKAPVIVRRTREDGSREYLLAGDRRADTAMTRVLRRKLEKAGLEDAHLETTVQFNQTYAPRAKTKLATVKGVKHKGSICPVVVTGTPEAVRFAWTVGVGELTGSGFGALR